MPLTLCKCHGCLSIDPELKSLEIRKATDHHESRNSDLTKVLSSLYLESRKILPLPEHDLDVYYDFSNVRVAVFSHIKVV